MAGGIERLVANALVAVRREAERDLGKRFAIFRREVLGWARKSSRTDASTGLEGPKPVARKSCRAGVTSWATVEGIIGAGFAASHGGWRMIAQFDASRRSPHGVASRALDSPHPL